MILELLLLGSKDVSFPDGGYSEKWADKTAVE
jgi:hypothetical protein